MFTIKTELFNKSTDNMLETICSMFIICTFQDTQIYNKLTSEFAEKTAINTVG